jgi:phosphoglycerol transferase MdoB-like AlkP superfamily enzyme
VARAALPRENPTAAVDAAIDAVGLLASLLVLWGEWTRMVRPPEAVHAVLARRPPPAVVAASVQGPQGSAAPATCGPPLIVAIQCESFLNPRGRGLAAPRLEAFERASAQALHSGRLGVPAFAANTMRAEFAFLSGLPNASLACDRFNPYLAAPAYGDVVWPARLRRQGWRTLFVHPYDRWFFERDRVVPALGFERAIWQEDFGSAARRGHYIADLAVARRILQEADAATEPTFVFAVTMENHGPWGDGRLPGIDAPLDQYLHHLEGADAMVAALMEGLRHRAGPTLLCLYGDHVPALRGLGPEAEAGLTDFVIVDPSARTPAAGGREPRRVEELLALCVAAVQP